MLSPSYDLKNSYYTISLHRVYFVSCKEQYRRYDPGRGGEGGGGGGLKPRVGAFCFIFSSNVEVS